MNEKQVILVVGSGRENIGHAVAKKFKSEGWYVIGTDLRFTEEARLAHDEVFTGLDICNEDNVSAMFQQIKEVHGRLDAVVNSAGQNILGPITDYKLEDFMLTINTNLTSQFLVTKHYVQKFNGNGMTKNILAVTSDTGSYLAKTSTFAYGASKAGANAFMQAVARELDKYHEDNWNVHAFACGMVEGTPMDVRTINDLTEQRNITPEQARGLLTGNIPKGRGLRMDEAAEWVHFLITKGEYASGNILRIDNNQQQG